MSLSITIEELSRDRKSWLTVDVRKEGARRLSGLEIGGSQRRLPFNAENWWSEFIGEDIVVYCVHGHEVSRAVCGFLADNGINARFLEGGFEAWREAGLPVVETGDAGR